MNFSRVMRLLGAIMGTYAAFCFVYADWYPLPKNTPNWEISNGRDVSSAFGYISDPDKREFFIRIYETFEAGNPRSEKQDIESDVQPTPGELREYYRNFDGVLSIIRVHNCPQKKVVVPSLWLNLGVIDREFKVFDIPKCKRIGENQ